MRSPIRYQSRLLYRRSYKPGRLIRIRPAQGMTIMFRPVRIGAEPKPSSLAAN